MKPDQAEQQTAKSIEAIQQAAPQVELSYFLQLWPDCFNHAAKQDAPCIAVIGTGVPDIYLRACGLTPIFLFGGTYCSHEQSALFFPPVSDPAVRSAAEWLMSKTPEEIAAAVISPENSDALKVQDYLRKSGFTVLTLEREVMPQNEMPSAYRDEQMRFLLQLESIAAVPALKRLYQEAAVSTKAHRLLRRLDKSGYPQMLKAFIRQSFYWALDREEWLRQAETLLANAPPPADEDILLIGSPIYFPNSKIHSILREVGLTQYQNFCGAPYPIDYSKLRPSDDFPSLLEQLHQIHYGVSRNDACALYGGAIRSASGIVFHLLKGQLKYAYEAEHIEKSAIQQGIPFICVETDYNDGDYEQVKVRLEGFAELLRRKHN